MTVHIITMVPSLSPQTEGEMKASPVIQELREALKKHGGDAVLPLMLGDATVNASTSLNPDLGPFDICITRHASIEDYVIATESHMYQIAAKDNKVMAFGFSNNDLLLNYVLPALKSMYNLFQKDKVDCESKSTEKVDCDLFQASGERGIDSYKRRVSQKNKQKFYLITLSTKDESPEGRKAEMEYEKSFLPAAFSSDLNIMYRGRLVSLDKGPKIFEEVSIVEYPTREFFVNWLESEYRTKIEQEHKKYVLDKFVQIGVPIF